MRENRPEVEIHLFSLVYEYDRRLILAIWIQNSYPVLIIGKTKYMPQLPQILDLDQIFIRYKVQRACLQCNEKVFGILKII